MLRSGLGFERCDVACCLNVSADHLGCAASIRSSSWRRSSACPFEIATNAAVLNADDPHCLQMADYTDAERLCYVTMNPSHALVKQHIRAGGQAFVLEQAMNGHMITIYDGEVHTPLLWTHLIPATIEGRAMHNVQNAMFAAALAYNMDISLEDIRHGLRTFDSSFFQAPGRMNIYDEHPFKVILDYAHNPAAVQSDLRRGSIDSKSKAGALWCWRRPVTGVTRTSCDIARDCGRAFRSLHLPARRQPRGRGDDEVPSCSRTSCSRKVYLGRTRSRSCPDEQEATRHALEIAEAG